MHIVSMALDALEWPTGFVPHDMIHSQKSRSKRRSFFGGYGKKSPALLLTRSHFVHIQPSVL